MMLATELESEENIYKVYRAAKSAREPASPAVNNCFRELFRDLDHRARNQEGEDVPSV